MLSASGGIDISTGTGTAGNDIDILSGASINLTAKEAAADSLVIASTNGGIDISTGFNAATRYDIDILGGGSVNISAVEGAADAITLVAPQGGIDISTGSGTGDIDILSGDAINLNAVSGAISFSAGTTTTASGLTIENGGQVGIGTASPSQALEVSGTVKISTTGSIQIDGNSIGTVTQHDLSFRVNSSIMMTLDDLTGNFGIGDTSPDDKLDVEDANLGYNFLFGSGGITFSTATGDNILMKSAGTISLSGGTSTNASGITVTTAGKVGVGQASPTYMFELGEDSAAKPTSNTWTVVSDERLKENIQGFGDGLDIIKQINTVSYELNGQAGTPKGAKGIGVIAQQVKDIIPYTIKTFLSGGEEYFSFDSSPLTFVLINAIKELSAKVESLSSLATDTATLQSNYSQLSKDLALLKESSSSSSLYTAYSIPYTDASASAVLGASDSGQLGNITGSYGTLGETTGNYGNLDGLGVNGNLTVTDQTYLNELSVSGLTTIGTLVIDPTQNSLNTLTAPMSLQSLALAPIHFQGTKIVIATNGDLEIKQGRLIGNDRIRGQITINPKQTKVTLNQDWESTPSSVVVTPLFDTYSWITNTTDKGFTVNLKSPPQKEEKVNWFAIW